MLEVTRHAHELVQVLDARLILRLLVFLQFLDIFRFVEHFFHEIIEVHLRCLPHEGKDHAGEG